MRRYVYDAFAPKNEVSFVTEEKWLFRLIKHLHCLNLTLDACERYFIQRYCHSAPFL